MPDHSDEEIRQALIAAGAIVAVVAGSRDPNPPVPSKEKATTKRASEWNPLHARRALGAEKEKRRSYTKNQRKALERQGKSGAHKTF